MNIKKFFEGPSQKSNAVEQAADLAVSSLFVLYISLACISALFQLAADAFHPQHGVMNGTAKINPADPNNGLPAAKQLAQWDNLIKTRLLHATEINHVVIGKDGWLYVDDTNSMSDYRGLNPYTDEEMAALANVIDNRQKWLSDRGIRLMLVVAPNKESIYTEYLPDNIRKVNNTTRLDQLTEYLRLHSNVDVLDLRDALLQAKSKMPLYYITDSHWNNYGAFIAYTQIMKKLSDYYPYLKAYDLSDYTVNVSSGYESDLAHLLFMGGLFKDQSVQMTLKDNAGQINRRDKIPSVVVYRDSFYGALEPFLSQHFVNSSVFQLGVDSMFNEPEMAQASPQIVIYVMVERYIDRYFPSQ